MLNEFLAQIRNKNVLNEWICYLDIWGPQRPTLGVNVTQLVFCFYPKTLNATKKNLDRI